jgi:hypothetical protein
MSDEPLQVIKKEKLEKPGKNAPTPMAAQVFVGKVWHNAACPVRL